MYYKYCFMGTRIVVFIIYLCGVHHVTLLTVQTPDDARHPGSPGGHALWRLGFRPFYLLAATFAAVSLPLWIAQYFGLMGGLPYAGLNWHMHEMVFGFAIAVIVGFLYTAARAWTGMPTPRGGRLAALAALWMAGRIAMFAGPPALAAIVDVLFIPAAAWPLYRVLRHSANKKNLLLIALLGLLAIANTVFHGAALGWIFLSPVLPVQTGIFIIVTLESVIGARVIPVFTANAVPGAKPIVNPLRDRAGFILIVLTSIAWLCRLPAGLVATLAFATGCSLLLRLIGWKPHRTVHQPLLWILHLAYAWIPIGFFLLALAAVDMASASAAFHALTVGSMAGLIVGMITRTALGHTGRPLIARRAEVTMYVLIQISAVARLYAAVEPSVFRNGALVLAMVSWSATFLLYVGMYGPYLWRPRYDGRDG
jgi:uncharacterized protein involved in response to NO